MRDLVPSSANAFVIIGFISANSTAAAVCIEATAILIERQRTVQHVRAMLGVLTHFYSAGSKRDLVSTIAIAGLIINMHASCR